jgi:hypothetical protein
MEDMAMSTTTFTVVLIFFIAGYCLYRFIRWLLTARVTVPVGGIDGFLSGGTFLAAAAQTNDQMWRDMQESTVRDNRANKLRNLERDLEQAEKLLALERKAHDLRQRYLKDRRKNGRPHCPELDELFQGLREDIERMKRS